MSDDEGCGCGLGELAYVDDGEVIEPDLVLDEPELEAAPSGGLRRALGAFALVDDELLDLDDDAVGLLDSALSFGLKLGQKVADVVSAPSKSKAKQARLKAAAAQQQAAELKAELQKAREREEKQRRQQQINDERRRTQAHEREKRALEDQIKELQTQQMLVRREVGKKAAEVQKAEEKAAEEKVAGEKERRSRSRKLAIGGGVAATSLLAMWALTRQRKPEVPKEKKR